jgi:hypothetical protein
MVEFAALILTPLPLVLADKVDTGLPVATPVIANCADDVDCPPTLKSYVEFIGDKRLPLSWK